MKMKRLLTLVALLVLTVMMTGCLDVQMKINKDGSAEMTYTIDMSQMGDLMSEDDLKTSIEESVDGMNEDAGEDIAELESLDVDDDEMVAVISIKDLNEMGDETFFGTVEEFRDDDGEGLDDMMDVKEKNVREKKISDKLQMVYLPMNDDTEEYGMVEITVIVPGKIVYVTDGADIEEDNEVVFDGQLPLVIYEEGGGFPFALIVILLFIVAVGVFVLIFKMKPKKAVSTTTSEPKESQPAQAIPVALAIPTTQPSVAVPIAPVVIVEDHAFVEDVEVTEPLVTENPETSDNPTE